MDCQNQYLTLEVQNLQLYISQLLEEKAKDKLAFQGKVQGLTKAHVATILDEKKSASENKNLKMELADQATVKDLMVKHDATVTQLDAVRLQHGEAIQQMEHKHAEETSRLQDLMSGLEDRNSELVEAVDIMRETASKNVRKIAEVEKALIQENDRLQQQKEEKIKAQHCQKTLALNLP